MQIAVDGAGDDLHHAVPVDIGRRDLREVGGAEVHGKSRHRRSVWIYGVQVSVECVCQHLVGAGGVEGAAHFDLAFIAAFEEDFSFGAHKLFYLAKLARECPIVLYSRSDREESRSMFCEKAEDPKEILSYLTEKYGPDFTAYIIPQGGIVLPVES